MISGAECCSIASAHREGLGVSRIARERASLTERTLEIFLQASRIPHRCCCNELCEPCASNAATIALSRTPASTGASSECGAAARYSGPPTKKAILCGGIAPRISVQNLSQLSHHISPQVALRLRSIQQEHALLLGWSDFRSRRRQCNDGRGHATFSLRLAGFGGATRFFSARAFNIFSLLWRRLIFCLRRRLNLALSPLTPDMLISCLVWAE